ncbi:hypothetical protein H5410_000355 [Solanum commersonii]|uniref:Uncharacterized protein n=1 Tax=Solanum commersonii TaxID=4109 RepID=A0A9J6AVT2_SOLCO|nr:hypothetical protein H5410_000355 [Solanum commersonii]
MCLHLMYVIRTIPTTRAVSPKLGRNKNSTSTTNSSESGGSSFSPRVVNKEWVKSPRAMLSTSNKVTGASKGGKPIETKKPMKTSSTTKTKGKAVVTKSKPAEAKALDENICEEKSKEMLEQPDEKSEMNRADINPDEKSEMNRADINAEKSPNAIVMPSAQVTVEG